MEFCGRNWDLEFGGRVFRCLYSNRLSMVARLGSKSDHTISRMLMSSISILDSRSIPVVSVRFSFL